MNTVYALENLPETITSTLFLAGPTPRDSETPSWRPQALEILAELGYQGTVLLPEDRTGQWKHSYDDQVEWEARMRTAADIILFWIPRDMSIGSSGHARMPALTTNVEFGLDVVTGKMLYGRPDAAGKNKYLDHLWLESTGLKPETDFNRLLSTAVSLLGEGYERSGQDAYISLGIHLHVGFEKWRSRKEASGHKILFAEQLLAFPVPKAGSTPWLLVASVGVDVAEEGRTKNNEIIISRPDTSAVAAFYDSAEGLRVLLIREFRSAAIDNNGMVLELPGGSCNDSSDALETAIVELREETGISVHPARLVHVASRQMVPTLLTHSTHLYALLLTENEVEHIKTSICDNRIHGADSSERITLLFPLVSETSVMSLDWSVTGMIEQARNTIIGS